MKERRRKLSEMTLEEQASFLETVTDEEAFDLVLDDNGPEKIARDPLLAVWSLTNMAKVQIPYSDEDKRVAEGLEPALSAAQRVDDDPEPFFRAYPDAWREPLLVHLMENLKDFPKSYSGDKLLGAFSSGATHMFARGERLMLGIYLDTARRSENPQLASVAFAAFETLLQRELMVRRSRALARRGGPSRRQPA